VALIVLPQKPPVDVAGEEEEQDGEAQPDGDGDKDAHGGGRAIDLSDGASSQLA
jgi:hypothetical protein